MVVGRQVPRRILMLLHCFINHTSNHKLVHFCCLIAIYYPFEVFSCKMMVNLVLVVTFLPNFKIKHHFIIKIMRLEWLQQQVQVVQEQK